MSTKKRLLTTICLVIVTIICLIGALFKLIDVILSVDQQRLTNEESQQYK